MEVMAQTDVSSGGSKCNIRHSISSVKVCETLPCDSPVETVHVTSYQLKSCRSTVSKVNRVLMNLLHEQREPLGTRRSSQPGQHWRPCGAPLSTSTPKGNTSGQRPGSPAIRSLDRQGTSTPCPNLLLELSPHPAGAYPAPHSPGWGLPITTYTPRPTKLLYTASKP